MSSSGTTASSSRPKVFVLYTGGTIGCAGSPLAPLKAGAFAAMVAAQPGFSVVSNEARTVALDVNASDEEDVAIDVTMDAIEPAIDSSSMTPGEWADIAQRILKNYAGYDGIVVLHGTDTMAVSFK